MNGLESKIYEDSFQEGINLMARLSKQLIDNGQYEELVRVANDREYCYEKMVEHKIISEEKARQMLSAAIKSGRLSEENEVVAVRNHPLEKSEI